MANHHISSQYFDYAKETVAFYADISTLQASSFDIFGMKDEWGQGFIMVSLNTGKTVSFYLEETHRDGDGDITHWTFKPSPYCQRKHNLPEGLKAVVYND